MTSGEPDGTLRIKAVVQYSSSELQSIIHGQISTNTLTEEGSENQSGDWADVYSFFTLSDDNTLKETGSYSLKIASASGEGTLCEITYELSTSIAWQVFKSLAISCHDNSLGQAPTWAWIGIETDAGLRAYKYSTGNTLTTPSGSWKTTTITKSDFTSVDAGITSDSVVSKVLLIFYKSASSQDASIWVDSITVTYSGGYEPINIDSDGNLQVDTSMIDADLITGASPNNKTLKDLHDLLTTIDSDTNDIKTAAEAIQTAAEIMDDWDDSDTAKVSHSNRSTDWQNILSADGILKTEENGKIVVVTDIIYQANANDTAYIRQGGAAGTIIQNINVLAFDSKHYGYITGLKGASYDGSGAGNIYISGMAATGRVTALGYMEDA